MQSTDNQPAVQVTEEMIDAYLKLRYPHAWDYLSKKQEQREAAQNDLEAAFAVANPAQQPTEDPRISIVEQWRQQTALGRSDETAKEMLARLDALSAEGKE